MNTLATMILAVLLGVLGAAAARNASRPRLRPIPLPPSARRSPDRY